MKQRKYLIVGGSMILLTIIGCFYKNSNQKQYYNLLPKDNNKKIV